MRGRIASGLAWWRRRGRRSPLPVKDWLPALREAHGPEKAERLLEAAEVRYRSLVATRPLPEHRRLRGHLLNHILPGLALYQVLREDRGGDQQAALDEIAKVFRAWAQAQFRPAMRALSLVPWPFAVFRLAFLVRMRHFPRAGWDSVVLENSPRRVAFDMRSCFYLETLAALGAPELTASFCQMDDWMAELLPPGIAFRRTQTLGRGGPCCDFRYEAIPGPGETRSR